MAAPGVYKHDTFPTKVAVQALLTSMSVTCMVLIIYSTTNFLYAPVPCMHLVVSINCGE